MLQHMTTRAAVVSRGLAEGHPPHTAEHRQSVGSRPRVAVTWPGGRSGDTPADVHLRLRNAGQLSLLATGQAGALAEAYVAGELDIEGTPADVMAVAALLIGNPLHARPGLARWRALAALRSRWAHRIGRDAESVRFHYDLGDEFFALWLDPMRVYSCAYWPRPGLTLAQAQQAKLDLVCRKLQLKPGQRLLDIGAGWGALLLWAARHHGVQAVGVTLSRQQHAHVERLIAEQGLRSQVEVRLADYRTLDPRRERFDRIASVGMFEHVGRAQLNGYFARLHALLRPGGLLLNHGIAAGGLDNHELGAGLGRFIERHIFPGGELVHVAHGAEALARGGLELLDVENLRPHYARTLWAWSDALEGARERASALSSESTVRAWRVYLAGSALAFERGWLQLYQMLATRPDGVVPPRSWAARSDYPYTRSHMAG
jgi:cyclopropane-fatty-acyl-phospholipid synthase